MDVIVKKDALAEITEGTVPVNEASQEANKSPAPEIGAITKKDDLVENFAVNQATQEA